MGAPQPGDAPALGVPPAAPQPVLSPHDLCCPHRSLRSPVPPAHTRHFGAHPPGVSPPPLAPHRADPEPPPPPPNPAPNLAGAPSPPQHPPPSQCHDASATPTGRGCPQRAPPGLYGHGGSPATGPAPRPLLSAHNKGILQTSLPSHLTGNVMLPAPPQPARIN